MSESTGATASTIHRLLGYHPVDGFRVNAQSPLEVDVVVVDEALHDRPKLNARACVGFARGSVFDSRR